MNKLRICSLVMLAGFLLYACNDSQTSHQSYPSKKKMDMQLLLKTAGPADTPIAAPYYFTLEPVSLQCRVPALQSFVFASYQGLWFFIGGEKNGFHGTGNDPKPFNAKFANDSIWMIDPVAQQSWSVPVPSAWKPTLCATNSAYDQNDSLLFICGGYSRTDTAQPNFNYTSNSFVAINLSSLISYIKSGGSSMPFDYTVTRQAQSPYVQVTGGALLQYGNYFYLIGGQNYNRNYTPGVTGIYTNAIRRFSLQNSNGTWLISDTASYIDPVNLHRRDMNVVTAPGDGVDAILYGGVFTKDGSAFRNAVYIGGLNQGNPFIRVDSSQQIANQYSCAVATISDSMFSAVVSVFFGGISYEIYNKDSAKLVVGDNGIPMPFSNIISTMISDNNARSIEMIQYPPYGPLLPGFIGANAIFIPAPHLEMTNRPGVIDVAKINKDSSSSAQLGYLFGGILSRGPTSGTTPKGHVPTYVNQVLYKVYLNADNN